MLIRKVRQHFLSIKEAESLDEVPLRSIISEMENDDDTLSFYKFDSGEEELIKRTLLFIGERPADLKYLTFEEKDLFNRFSHDDTKPGDIAFVPGRSKHVNLINLCYKDIETYIEIIKNKEPLSINKPDCVNLMKKVYEEYLEKEENERENYIDTKKVFIGFFIELSRIYKKENNQSKVDEVNKIIDSIADRLLKKHDKQAKRVE